MISVGREDRAYRRDRRRTPAVSISPISGKGAIRTPHIDLFEQNAAGATWGFGVVFSEAALEFLRADDPDTVDAIAPRMESWKNITLNLRGESVEIDGVGFSSIGRLELLTILQQRASAVGVMLRYDTAIESVDAVGRLRSDRRGRRPELAGAPQLRERIRRVGVVGDQQVRLVRHHKTVRDAVADLCATELGAFNAHHYRYSPGMSTFLVECDRRDLASLRLCRQEHRAVASHLRAGVCRDARRPQADVEQIGVAQFPLDLERTLVVRKQGADRRRPAFGAFFDRLRHAARHRGRHRVGQGAGGGDAIFRRRWPVTRASASRS